MKKILVAIDGSEISEQVLQKAKTIGEQFNSEILVMTIVKRLVPSYHYRLGADFGHTHLVDKESEEIAERMISHAKEVFTDYTGKFDTLLAHGDPAEGILEIAEKENPDLLIMGNRGLGGFKRIMLGSVSTKVLHHAGCTVMIVKHQ
ncbi:MAG: universal stress protein [Bacillota bacterium]|nr:universal stress protein [Bacillota bacterium]MDW7677046.1 universal stress protein [Bacillota bacterium]